MNYYDFPKATNLINTLKPASASLGLKEDWFWTAETVYSAESGWTRVFYNGDDIIAEARLYFARTKELLSQVKAQRDTFPSELAYGSARLGARAKAADDFRHILVNSLVGSCWATPVLLLTFSDGREEFHEVRISDGPAEAPRDIATGYFSAETQERIKTIPVQK